MMSLRSLALGALTTTSVWPVAAMAQERQPQARARIYVDRDTTLQRNRIRMVTERRARLGIMVDLESSADDSIGAKITSVTPGGPAAKAGIKSGDIITRIDGKIVTATAGEKAGMGESLPGLRLVEIAAQLKPHDTVSVEFRRDGARRTVQLVTGDEPIMVFDYPDWTGRGVMLPKIEAQRMLPRSGGGNFEFGPGAGSFAFTFGGPFMDLQLAPINPDLGQYFGTTEGVLVIDVPKESTLGVKGGDVILSVDGRKANGPGSLMRILRSYDPGDSFKLEIMRNKSRMTVSGHLEKAKDE